MLDGFVWMGADGAVSQSSGNSRFSGDLEKSDLAEIFRDLIRGNFRDTSFPHFRGFLLFRGFRNSLLKMPFIS